MAFLCIHLFFFFFGELIVLDKAETNILSGQCNHHAPSNATLVFRTLIYELSFVLWRGFADIQRTASVVGLCAAGPGYSTTCIYDSAKGWGLHRVPMPPPAFTHQ